MGGVGGWALEHSPPPGYTPFGDAIGEDEQAVKERDRGRGLRAGGTGGGAGSGGGGGVGGPVCVVVEPTREVCEQVCVLVTVGGGAVG